MASGVALAARMLRREPKHVAEQSDVGETVAAVGRRFVEDGDEI